MPQILYGRVPITVKKNADTYEHIIYDIPFAEKPIINVTVATDGPIWDWFTTSVIEEKATGCRLNMHNLGSYEGPAYFNWVAIGKRKE